MTRVQRICMRAITFSLTGIVVRVSICPARTSTHAVSSASTKARSKRPRLTSSLARMKDRIASTFSSATNGTGSPAEYGSRVCPQAPRQPPTVVSDENTRKREGAGSLLTKKS